MCIATLTAFTLLRCSNLGQLRNYESLFIGLVLICDLEVTPHCSVIAVILLMIRSYWYINTNNSQPSFGASRPTASFSHYVSSVKQCGCHPLSPDRPPTSTSNEKRASKVRRLFLFFFSTVNYPDWRWGDPSTPPLRLPPFQRQVPRSPPFECQEGGQPLQDHAPHSFNTRRWGNLSTSLVHLHLMAGGWREAGVQGAPSLLTTGHK